MSLGKSEVRTLMLLQATVRVRSAKDGGLRLQQPLRVRFTFTQCRLQRHLRMRGIVHFWK